jgi:vacuolar-type H+-ATPase subunit F/Vma7
VLEAYKNAIKNLNFFGPTHFNEIINTVNNMAEDLKVSQDNQKYIILLIITDGIINDMEQTIDEIVRGSSLPLSIIIVGVGDAEFNSMDILDADDEPLFSKKF